MEFDKSRVYTAVNAEELPIGSICVFADTIRDLRRKIEEGKDTIRVKTFAWLHIDGEGCGDIQFSDGFYTYNYVYLIEPLAEPKYLPFASNNKAMEAIGKHGGWVKHKNEQYSFITAIDIGEEDGYEIKIDDDWFSADELLKNYVFADDGSPCGVLVEE